VIRIPAPLILTLSVFWSVPGAFAQTREDHSHFEVASIKPVDRSAPLGYTGPETGDPGRLAISRVSLRLMIADAYPEYGRFGERISGPAWIENEYSVAATIPPGSTTENVTQMFRNLLAERFGLKFHDENKDVEGFDLTIGQSGFKLTPSTAPAESAPKPVKRDRDGIPVITGQGTWGSTRDRESGVLRTSFQQCSMKQLADMLSMTYGERSVPVTDKTEITGLFDFRLVLPIPSVTFRPWLGEQRPPPDASVIDLRDLSGSLEKQTGLRLKLVKLTLPAMVIDSVARTPSEN
jgi:uncharacterized protein (TIGR03435 family)